MSEPETPTTPAPSEPDGLLGVAGRLAEGRGRTRMGRLARWALVLPLLVLWIVGWITPIVPGFPFLIAALLLMAPDVPVAHRLGAWIQRKLPLRMRRTIPKRWRRTIRVRP